MMPKIVYDADLMKRMSAFEINTGARLKDMVVNENFFWFIVQPGEIAKAIGPRAVNVHHLESVFKRRIRIVEFAAELVSFIKNLIYPLAVAGVSEQEGVFTLIPVDSRTRSMLIGKNACNLRFYESVVKRYFPITELRVGRQNGK